jgi:hypothetical protein
MEYCEPGMNIIGIVLLGHQVVAGVVQTVTPGPFVSTRFFLQD